MIRTFYTPVDDIYCVEFFGVELTELKEFEKLWIHLLAEECGGTGIAGYWYFRKETDRSEFLVLLALKGKHETSTNGI